MMLRCRRALSGHRRRLEQLSVLQQSAASLSTSSPSGENKQHAFAVILGGGVAGSSIAYHLAQRGVTDVFVLDRHKLASPTGTTFHSPGLSSAAHVAHRYKPILAYSVELYQRLGQETGIDVGFEAPGTLRLATNQTRLEEFRRYTARDFYKEGDVCKTSLISPDEIAKLAPMVDTSKVLGALYTTNDGYVDARALNRALIAGAVKKGVRLIDESPHPQRISWDGSVSQWVLEFADGSRISTRNLINASGIWAHQLARLSGHSLPVTIVEHQYAVLTPRADSKPPPGMPVVIDHDSTFYIRRSAEDKLLFGGFEPQSRVVFREDWYRDGTPEGGSTRIEADFSRLDDAFKRARELWPAVSDAAVEAHAAVFSMTADGYPLVGPYDKNYWLSTGFLDGVSSGGGIGRYLADWIVDGEPPAELFDTDASRFDRWADRPFILEKCKETYSMFYNWMTARPTSRVSGVYGRLKKQGGRFAFRNGWEVSQLFDVDEEEPLAALSREYQRVVNRCGVIDLSWKGKIEVKGPDSLALLDYAFASKIPPLGEIGSAVMLTRKGRLLSPMKVFHHDNHRSQFILLTEPERESRDLYWLRRAAHERNMSVQLNSVSEYLASLAIVGPNSREVLSSLTMSDVSETGMPVRTTRLLRLGTVPVMCARSSTSTGQLSYELFHNRADSLRLYEALLKAGAAHGICNFGQETLNVMRLEHGFKIWGRELTLDTNPFEAGLEPLVDLDNKKDFIGYASALEARAAPRARRLALLQFPAAENEHVPLEWSTIAKGMEVVRRAGQEERIGQITSGTYSSRLQQRIAFAWLDQSVQDDEAFSVDLGTHRLHATVLREIPHAPIN